MADRQYSGMQPGYNPQLLQQQQHHMMNQLPDSQPSSSSFPTQENGRLWQQQLQHLNQPQFRPQPGQDLNSAQINQQIDSLRNGNHSRNGQQQFVGGNSNQPFPDQHNQNFNPMNMANQSMNREMMQSLAHNAQGNPMTRQMQLMNQAQNQAQQNSLAATRMMQQQAALQQANIAAQAGTNRLSPQQSELFVPPTLSENMRRSPLPPAQQSPLYAPAQPGQPRRPMTFTELRELAGKIRSFIAQEEDVLANLTNNRAGTSDAVYLPRAQALQASLNNKADYLKRIFAAMQQIHSATTQNPANLNLLPPQNPPPAPGMHNPAMSSQAWMNQQMPNQALSHLGAAQNQSNLPPRSTQTPQQQHPGQFPNQNAGQTFPFAPGAATNNQQRPPNQQDARAVAQNSLNYPPLDKERFHAVFSNFCKSKGVNPDSRLLQEQNRPIDLWRLHTEVHLEGGVTKVNQHDLWNIIGGRLGFVQFPGSDNEPPKSGPGVAQRLAHVYKEYISAFDMVYLNSVIDMRRKAQAQAQSNALQNANRNVNPAPPLNRTGPVTAAQMQAMSNYATMSVADLRNQKLPENMIHFIETHRPQLQRASLDQVNFRDDLRHGPQPGEMNRVSSNHSEPYPNNAAPFPHQQNGAPGNERRAPTTVLNPTGEQMLSAVAFIKRYRAEFTESSLPALRPQIIPDNQRPQFKALVESVYHLAADVEQKLPMYYVLLKEEVVKRMIAISLTAHRQRQLLSAGTPTFILTFDMLKSMMSQMRHANEIFQTMFTSITPKQGPNGPMGGRPPPQAGPSMPSQAMGLNFTPNRQAPMNLQPPKRRGAISAGSPSGSHPTPPASTPNAAPSPMAMPSPQTPKSPPKKVPAKKAPVAKRRASNAKPAQTPPTSNPSPATSQKRARDEDVPLDVNFGPDPSPKRSKTETEGQDSGSMVKREQEVANVRTEEDASEFLERMTELIKMAAAGGEGQEALTSDISDTLDIILKGYGGVSDGPEHSSDSSLDLADMANLEPTPIADEFNAFFDFSGCTAMEDDDGDSKPPTPELISSSSTNPSPESGSEAEVGHGSAPDYANGLEFARESVWKEIDGGESQYYHNADWKWDGPPSTQDPAWAIYPS